MLLSKLQHDHLCKFPAKQFYDERMFTNPATAEEMKIKTNKLKKFWPNRNSATPFVFCDVIGTEGITETEFISKTRVGQESKFNNLEADKIVRHYRHLYCKQSHVFTVGSTC